MNDRVIVLRGSRRKLATPRALSIVLLLILLGLVPSLFLRVATQAHIYTSPEDLPHADAALVPGASVVHGAPSPVLAERADAAIRLYTEGRVAKIIVTGDNGERDYDEVTPVREYLVGAGVPVADIFLDHAGFDTYSSMYRARAVFRVRSLIIVTQDFHLSRAVFLARTFGIDASGLVAHGGNLSGYVREIPASWKALWDIMTHREPKYLGAPIPLSGRSNAQ